MTFSMFLISTEMKLKMFCKEDLNNTSDKQEANYSSLDALKTASIDSEDQKITSDFLKDNAIVVETSSLNNSRMSPLTGKTTSSLTGSTVMSNISKQLKTPSI